MRKGGFTLVEAIVALAVAAIFSLCASMLVGPILKIYRQVAARSDGQMIAGNVMDAIRKETAYAQSLTVTDEVTLDLGDGKITLSPEGYLETDGELAFAEGYYNGKKLQMTCAQAEKDQADVTLSVYTQDRELCRVSARVSPLRNVLTRTYSIYEPEGMRQITLETAKNHTGWNANNDIFADVYQNIYGGAVPEYSMDNILSKERRQALLDAATEQYGPYSPKLKRYKELLNDTYYLAVGVTKTTLVPIVYVTNSPGTLNNQPHASMTMVYFDYAWYFPAENSGYYLPQFNGKTEEEIRSLLADETQWIPVSKLRG